MDNKPDICEAVELLLGRLQSHPEEFLAPSGHCGVSKKKLYDYITVFRPFMNKDEEAAVEKALHDIAMSIFNEQLMHRLLQGDTPDEPQTYAHTQGFQQQLSTLAAMGAQAGLQGALGGVSGLAPSGGSTAPTLAAREQALMIEEWNRRQRSQLTNQIHPGTYGGYKPEPEPMQPTLKQKITKILKGS
jgi:hypothetical protein